MAYAAVVPVSSGSACAAGSQIEFVGLGEVLFDVFENGEELLGGAPLNATFHVHQLASALGVGKGVLVSSVGADARGSRITSVLEEAGIETAFVARDSACPTGTVRVRMRDGEPIYTIEAGAAWDHLADSADLHALARRCQAVCFGSLAQRSETSRTTIQTFLQQAVDAVRLYDVNLRDSSVPAEKGFSVEIVRESCRMATAIKCNEEELPLVCSLVGLRPPVGFTEGELLAGADELLQRFPAHLIAVTRGAKGLLLRDQDATVSIEAAPLASGEVFPVGAGDACSAGLLFGLSLGWSMRDAGLLAARMGAWVASHRSATPPLSADILEFARSRACAANGQTES